MPSPLDSLPHGPSFRFLDRVEVMEPGRSAQGHYRLRGDEDFLSGHFPGQPVLPGVIMIEAIAQLAGVCAQSDPGNAPLADLRLAGVQRARILGTVGPGTDLRITAHVTGRMGGLIQASGTVEADDRTLARAEITLSGH